MSAFKQRLLTTVVLLPVALWYILYANATLFTLLAYAIYLGCAWEWLQLVPVRHAKGQWGVMLLFILMPGLVLFVLPYAVWAILCVWSLLAIAVVQYPRMLRYWGESVIVTVLGLIVLPVFLLTTIGIAGRVHMGRSVLLYGLCLVWACDIGAYLAGRYFGRVRLIPAVSPGKTREGLVGGLLCAVLVSWCASFYFKPTSFLYWTGLTFVIFIMALLGDLSMSMLKRRVQIKDTGTLLPGHGGLLDRLDSVIAVMPIYWVMTAALG